jgi:hypothetical protein
MARAKRHRKIEPTADHWANRQSLTPLLVGSYGLQPGDLETRRAAAMFIVIDPDEVRGLRNILKRQQAGHAFDVITRCGVRATKDVPEDVPLALFDIAFPEVGLALEIAVNVDESRRSLLEAIRSKQLVLVDAERSIALQTMDPQDAVLKGFSIGVPLHDVTPLIGLLQQRVDLPLPVYRPVAHDVAERDPSETIEEFARGAVFPKAIAIQYADTSSATIMVIDPELPDWPDTYTREVPMDGRWGVMLGEKASIIRLDAFHREEPFRSWIIAAPDLQIIRAGASGAHHVMLLKQPLSSDPQRGEQQWDAGISVWVEHVESLRALLLQQP